MAVDIEEDPRGEPPTQGDERATLAGFLRWQGETLGLKCAGLHAADMSRRSVEPSTLSLLGLVRHLAEVERFWLHSFNYESDSEDPRFRTHVWGWARRFGERRGPSTEPRVPSD
jgi:hypothetical protein